MKPAGSVFDKSMKQACTVSMLRKTDVQVQHMITKHYLGRWPDVVTLVLGLQFLDRYVGVLVYALPPRETNKRYGAAHCWELARLWVDDCMPKNTETFFIARGSAYIKTFRPDVEMLVSYVDPSAGHAGTVYKAANWVSDGRTDERRKTPRVSKHRFIYDLRG